jgi:hypothetical protein
VLTNVAIVVMRLVGLAPATVEQLLARSNPRCIGGFAALHDLREDLSYFVAALTNRATKKANFD